MKLQNLRIWLAGWLSGSTGRAVAVRTCNPLPEDLQIKKYFAESADYIALETYRMVREALIARKLIRKERSDKGSSRKTE